MQPRISIITICFNSEKTIEETIKSVVSQNYNNLEYIIIDGGSTDRTIEIVEKYSKQIATIISEPDKGISDAFNKGIKNATGDIIGIINSDDVLLPKALNNIAIAHEQGIDVYRGNIIIWDSENNAKITAYPTMKFPLRTFKKRIVCHQGTFITKKAYEQYGTYKEHFKYMMDVDLLIRLYESGAKFKYIPAELAMFRMGGVTSSSFLKKTGEIERLFRENGAGRLYAKAHVLLFIITNSILTVVRAIGLANFARKIKFRLCR